MDGPETPVIPYSPTVHDVIVFELKFCEKVKSIFSGIVMLYEYLQNMNAHHVRHVDTNPFILSLNVLVKREEKKSFVWRFTRNNVPSSPGK